MDYQLQNNKRRAIIALALRTAALLACTGPIMQTFLASLGFSSQFIYIHTTLVQAANILTSSLCAQWADRGNVIRRSAICEIPHALLYLAYIPLCLWKSPSFASFAMLTGIALIQSVCIALYTVCDYKLPYYIYGPRDYGTVLAISGVVSAVISLGAGLIITRLAHMMDYSALMLGACVVSCIMMGVSALLHALQQPLVPLRSSVPAQKESTFGVFRYPIFYRLIPANLLRGFAFGTTTVMAGVALDLGYDAGVSTAIVSFQSAAMLLGCGLFALSSHWISPRKVILLGSLSFLLIPGMLIPGKWLFLGLFTFTYFGRTLADYAIPSLLRLAVPAEIAGPYNAWRMTLHIAGTLIATSVAAMVSVWMLLVLTMFAQLLASLLYFTNSDMKVV